MQKADRIGFGTVGTFLISERSTKYRYSYLYIFSLKEKFLNIID